MYGNKLAAAIKVNGKVLREFKDTVYIPFGAEYAITLKNLHTTRAVVNVYIDGDNVVPGGLVLNAGQSVDLERSIKNNNLTEGNRFKFIERTGSVEEHRGIGVEDGLVRIEYQFEEPRPIINISDLYWKSTPQWHSNTPYYSTNSTLRSMNISGSIASDSISASATSASAQSFANETGITVPGSKSTQNFQTTTVGFLESTKHNLVFKLVGDLGDNKPVEKAVTVKAKPKCVTCGKQNKAHAKFCSECGTALEIFA